SRGRPTGGVGRPVPEGRQRPVVLPHFASRRAESSKNPQLLTRSDLAGLQAPRVGPLGTQTTGGGAAGAHGNGTGLHGPWPVTLPAKAPPHECGRLGCAAPRPRPCGAR